MLWFVHLHGKILFSMLCNQIKPVEPSSHHLPFRTFHPHFLIPTPKLTHMLWGLVSHFLPYERDLLLVDSDQRGGEVFVQSPECKAAKGARKACVESQAPPTPGYALPALGQAQNCGLGAELSA